MGLPLSEFLQKILMDRDKPVLVSVWMITFNHEKYIAQAIESVINQVTDFDFELVIGEDFSTDRTREICQAFQQKFPDKIKLLLHEGNVGIHQNIVLTLGACTGKYIAMLEGDDYWIDTLKLQKQADFLIAHPEFVMCYQKTLEIDEVFGKRKITNEDDNEVTGIEEILERGWFMRTGSLFFRNGIIQNWPSWFFLFSSTDYMLHILLAEHGKIGFLNETTSVYRRHEGGITQDFQDKLYAFNEKKLELLDIIDNYFQYRYHRQISIQKRSLYNSSFINKLKGMTRPYDFVHLLKLMPFISYSYLSKRLFAFLLKRSS